MVAPEVDARVYPPRRGRRKLPGQRQHTVCCACGEVRDRTRQCWGPCARWFHVACALETGRDRGGPFVCLDCKAADYCNAKRDFLADDDLMGYVAAGTLPADVTEAEASRLMEAAEHLRWDGDRLWFVAGGIERQIPPRWRRPLLIQEV